MKAASLLFLYSLFAAIATATNLLAQKLTIAVAGGGALWASLIVGTCVGLLTKYLLDKAWIFRHRSRTMAHAMRSFLLYALAGILTTVIFWGVELGFHHLFGSESMRYLGGAIGLAIGYTFKYRIDRSLAFRPAGVALAEHESGVIQTGEHR